MGEDGGGGGERGQVNGNGFIVYRLTSYLFLTYIKYIAR